MESVTAPFDHLGCQWHPGRVAASQGTFHLSTETPPMDDSGFAIEQRDRFDGTIVLALVGEFDLSADRALSRRLQGCVEDGFEVVVDLSAVTFLESVAIAALVAADNVARARNRRVRVASPSPHAFRVLALSGLLERLGVPDPT